MESTTIELNTIPKGWQRIEMSTTERKRWYHSLGFKRKTFTMSMYIKSEAQIYGAQLVVS